MVKSKNWLVESFLSKSRPRYQTQEHMLEANEERNKIVINSNIFNLLLTLLNKIEGEKSCTIFKEDIRNKSFFN